MGVNATSNSEWLRLTDVNKETTDAERLRCEVKASEEAAGEAGERRWRW